MPDAVARGGLIITPRVVTGGRMAGWTRPNHRIQGRIGACDVRVGYGEIGQQSAAGPIGAGGTTKPTPTRLSTEPSWRARGLRQPAAGRPTSCGARRVYGKQTSSCSDRSATLAGRRVLEIGCGAAQCGRWLARYGAAGRRHRYFCAAAAACRGPRYAPRRIGPLRCWSRRTPASLPLADASIDIAFSAFGAIPFVHRQRRRDARDRPGPAAGWPLGIQHQPPDALVHAR